MKNKKILIGVTGGIAAYKVCSLVNLFVREKANIKIIMTQAATKFVTPLTFQTLSGHQVYTDMFENINQEKSEHISLAQWADIVVISPATANIISKITHGISDDLLTTVITALQQKTKVVLSPAMNTEMWNNVIIQKNIQILQKYNKYIFIQPRTGILACRDKGIGKIADNKIILQKIKNILNKSQKNDGVKNS